MANKYRQLAGIKEVTDDIYLKLAYILKKIKDLPEPQDDEDDNLDARDAEGSVLPVEKICWYKLNDARAHETIKRTHSKTKGQPATSPAKGYSEKDGKINMFHNINERSRGNHSPASARVYNDADSFD